MTEHCEKCKCDSRVVLTRRAAGVQYKVGGVQSRNHICIVRTRQCNHCRWKWKTVEMPVQPRLEKKWRMV